MKKIKSNQRIYQKIVEIIKKDIAEGKYREGDTLPSERDLAKHLQVSRTSVREAIIALEVAGWVEVRLGSGIYVKNVQPSAITPSLTTFQDPELRPFLMNAEEISPFSLLQARLLIEPECAALAAKNMTSEALQLIKEAYVQNVSDNIMHSTKHLGDRLFHIRIAEASGNDAYAFLLRQLMAHQYGQLFTTLQRLYTPEDMPMRSQQEHLDILIALENKDVQAAKSAMIQHLTNVITIFQRSHSSQ